MDESLSELAEKFELLMDQGQELLGRYVDSKNGEVVFQDLLDHIKSVQRVQGEMQNLMIVGVVRLYKRCRKSKIEKNIAELGFFEAGD